MAERVQHIFFTHKKYAFNQLKIFLAAKNTGVVVTGVLPIGHTLAILFYKYIWHLCWASCYWLVAQSYSLNDQLVRLSSWDLFANKYCKQSFVISVKHLPNLGWWYILNYCVTLQLPKGNGIIFCTLSTLKSPNLQCFFFVCFYYLSKYVYQNGDE